MIFHMTINNLFLKMSYDLFKVVENRTAQETFLKTRFVIFRCQKYVKKRVHRNDKNNLPWDFKIVFNMHF